LQFEFVCNIQSMAQVLLSPGDEVILLEPFFDLYVGQIKMARGVPKYVSLRPDSNSWHLDAAALRAAITPKTRAIVLNSPHNPTGSVLTVQP
jgi:aspartate/methionine/tyrosine aminotransferase